MNYAHCKIELEGRIPINDWPEALKALWYDAKGDWHTAHELVDGKSDVVSNWIHAYLHRKDGDEWNARYWYRSAGKPFPKISLDEEHREITNAILSS